MRSTGCSSVAFLTRSNVRPSAIPPKDRKRLRLQDPALLVQLGLKLMAEAEEGTRPHPRMDAALFRDGLQIALLALRPVRRRNLADIAIGRNLVDHEGKWWLVFEAEETKSRQPIEVPFPERLIPALRRYVTHYRALLAGKRYRGQALWVSYHFTPQSAHSIQLRVAEHTKREFGKAISPHLVRDCVATSIAIHDPEHVRLATSILGHRTVSTTERHYNLAATMEAARAYSAAIRSQRKKHGRR